MSMNENTPVDTGSVESDDVNLDDFSAEFFGQNNAQSEPASSENDQDVDTDDNAPDDDTQSIDDDTVEPESDENEEEEVEDVEEKPKRRKQTAQERINEVVGQRRETERQLQAALDELARLKNKETEPEPTKVVAEPENTGPTPDDKLEDGSDKYPLGEFDPNYIRDLTKFTLQQERDHLKRQDEAEAQVRQAQQAQQELTASWEEKLGPAQERYPDFREKGEELVSTFEGIDANYGEYLTATLMSMDHGPDVLYYLASNPDLAQEIVDSGPTKATIALGRLEAMFMEDGKSQTRPRVSNAPTPPPTNKGSAVAAPSVPVDTDDLSAFEKQFFNKK